jgi:hypothetical protein
MLNALFKPVKIGTALNIRGLHWKTEPVSLYHVLNCFPYGPVLFLPITVPVPHSLHSFFRITGINVPRF